MLDQVRVVLRVVIIRIVLVYNFSLVFTRVYISVSRAQDSRLKTQNSKLKTQNSKTRTSTQRLPTKKSQMISMLLQ